MPSKVDKKNPWETLEQKVVYDNPWIELSEHSVLNPSGNKGIYSVIKFKNYAIGILPIDKDMNTWLVGQYRYPLNEFSWEIPEGGGSLDIDPLESARRELLEETGIVAKKYSELLRSHLSNSVSNELAIIYLAEELNFHEPEPEETEKLYVKKVPFEEFYQMVCKGEITDSLSVMAALKYKNLLNEK